jgi:elongation factor P
MLQLRDLPFSPLRLFGKLITNLARLDISLRYAGFAFMEVAVASIEYSQVRKGMMIVGEDGQLYTCVDRDLNTPGNWRAILQLKLKNLNTGSITINRVRPQDKVEQAYLDKRQMQYLYKDGDSYVFMDNENYDQFHLEEEMVGEMMQFLKENDNVHVIMYDDKAISVEPPATVNLKVVETEPAVKGATAAAQFKPATLETGLKITVPPFVGIGEMVAVDTRTGEYLSRSK